MVRRKFLPVMRALLLGKNPFVWLARTLRTKGPWRVAQILWQALLDLSWDIVHGTETLKRIRPHLIETESGNKGQATYYGATRARPLVHLLREVNLPLDGGFVDLGCGKGRVLLIAAEHGFRLVTGVDFSEPLCETARRNLAAFQRGRTLNAEVSVIHCDVVDYVIRPDDTVFFLYDPFHAKVLASVLDGLRQSLKASPRTLWLIYNSPRLHDVVQQSGLFSACRQFEIGGNEFSVYQTNG